MAKNEELRTAKKEKHDEFYTQYEDIQKEINAYIEYDSKAFKDKTVLLPCDDPEWSNFTRFFAQNFESFGIKKLISTSYAIESKNRGRSKSSKIPYQLSLFETESPKYDDAINKIRGKIFTLTQDKNQSGNIDIEDLEWDYLEGDGDFRSEEVKKLRDEADIIITNPPFSLFREFFAWIMEAKKNFIIIGNKNAITYKEIFPYLKNNEIWLGPSITSGGRNFRVPNNYTESKNFIYDEKGNKYVNIPGPRWFTNIDHGRRHYPLQLMTMADNLKFSSHKEIKENGYQKYDNYDAIEIPFTDAIPSDYAPCWLKCDKAKLCDWAKEEGFNSSAKALCEFSSGSFHVLDCVTLEQFAIINENNINNNDEVKKCSGIMGVPITFMDKYCPEQFEIIGLDRYTVPKEALVGGRVAIKGKSCYARILIKKR